MVISICENQSMNTALIQVGTWSVSTPAVEHGVVGLDGVFGDPSAATHPCLHRTGKVRVEGATAPVSVLPPQQLTSAPCPLAAACRLLLGHLDARCQSPPSLLACWRRPLRPSLPSPFADRDLCGCLAGMRGHGGTRQAALRRCA
jgi:hypothetical protein